MRGGGGGSVIFQTKFFFLRTLLIADSYLYTDKKEKENFLIYKEILSGAVAKSFMRKGFLIYNGKCANISPYMRRPLVMYDLQLLHSEFPYI